MQPTFSVSLIIQTYWSQITAGVLLILLIGKLMNTDTDQEKRLMKLEEKVEGMNPIWIDIRERLASIETTLAILIKR